jgi:hypothetical protein
MATVTAGYTWASGETVTPTKLNSAAAPTVALADGEVTSAKLATGIDASKLTDASVTPAKLSQPLTRLTEQTATGQTSFPFTSIPSWAKKITVMLRNVSTSGTGNLLIQLGSGSTTTSGYSSYGMNFGSSGGTGAAFTDGFGIKANGNAAEAFSGLMTISNVSGNNWVAQGGFGNSATVTGFFSVGGITLSGACDRVRLSTTGADTFDAGSVNVMYE